MTTLFSAALARLGLSQSEAAEYLAARLDTVKSWSAGRNPVAPGVWPELHRLAVRQRSAAEAIVAAWRDAGEPDRIDAALPSDAEIDRRSWPSRGSFIAVLAEAWSMLPHTVSVRIVPAESTPAVHAAAAARKLAE